MKMRLTQPPLQAGELHLSPVEAQSFVVDVHSQYVGLHLAIGRTQCAKVEMQLVHVEVRMGF